MRQPREKLPPSVGHPRRFSVPKGAATYGRMSNRILAPIPDPFRVSPNTPTGRVPFTPLPVSILASHIVCDDGGTWCGLETTHTASLGAATCATCRTMAQDFKEQN